MAVRITNALLPSRLPRYARDIVAGSARRLGDVANTIRGKILLAFCAFAALTGLLGAYAVTNVMGSGQLVVETYDKPLMAISYARLALTNFGAMELAQAQRQLTQDAASRLEFDAQIDTLAAALDENISVAQRRSLSQRATDAAKATAAEVAKWETLRRRLLSVGREGQKRRPRSTNKRRA